MATRMQQRRGTAAQWISTNSGNGPVLNAGEIGFESDTNKFKIGDGVNHWVDLVYFTDSESALAQINAVIDAAPAALDTLNELAAAINDDPTFFTTIATNLSTHASDTTSVHGIADTSELATKAFAATLLTGATKTNIAITGDKNGLTITAENGVADSTTSDLAEGTNLYFTDERAQDAVGNSAGSGLSYDDATGALSVDTSVIQSRVTGISNTEIGYLDGVTSAIQDQLNDKAPIANPTFTGTVSGITKAMVDLGNVDNTSDANKQISDLTQAALDLKAPIASPTFTGTVSGITKAMIGLGDVNNTSDAAKPVSTATQAALDLKAPLASPALTGTATAEDLTVSNDLIVDGNLTVSGTTTTVSTANFTTADALIYLGEGNNANLVDLGIVSSFDDGTYQHAGIVRDSSAGKWKLFKGVTDEPTTVVNFAQGSLDDLAVGALEATSLTVGNVTNTEIGYLEGLTASIQDQLDVKVNQTAAANTFAPIAAPTFTGIVSGITKSMVGLGNVDNTSDANKTISTATQSALDLKAPLESPTFTGTVVLPTGTITSTMIADGAIANADINAAADIEWTKLAVSADVSATELGYIAGVTSAVQTQLDSKISSTDAASTYQTKVSGVSNAEISYLDGVTSAIQDQIDLKAPIASPTFTGTVSGVTKSMVGLGNVDNTTDAAKPISDATQTALNLKAPLASPTFTGTVAGITKSMVGLGSVDNTSDANKPVSTATQTALDLKANLASPTFTGTVTLPTGTVTSAMILDGTIVAGDLADGAVTSAKILDGTIVNGDINASAAIDWTKLAISSTVSATEAGYLDGVTSAIQTQLNAKAPLSAPTFTGTVTSTNDVVVNGNLTVNGTTFNASSTSITIEDNMVQLAHQNAANTVDLGLVVAYNDGAAKHAGLVRDVSDSKWKLFAGVTTEPTTTVDFTQGSLDALAVGAFEASSATIGNVSNTELQYLDGVTSAIQTQINAKAPTASPTFTGTVTIPNGAALGTPASATLTNATGLPVATGIANLGTGVATFLTTPSSANFASMITDEVGTGSVVLSEIATSAQTASYTLVAADRAKMVEMNVATANTVTVPPNSSVAFPVGTKIDILQVGAGQTTVVAGAGVTVNATPGLKIRAQWGSASLIKRSTDTWVLVGDISA